MSKYYSSKAGRKSSKHNLKAKKAYDHDHNKNEASFKYNVHQDEIKIPYLLKCADPKTVFLLSLMLVASVYGGYKYINHATSPIGASSEPLDSSTKSAFATGKSTDLCKTAILYETHHDSAPVKFIDKMLPNLIKHNYTTFLFEEPKGMTLDQNVRRLDAALDRLSESYSVPGRMKEKLSDSVEATVNLLSKIKKQGLDYVAVDMDDSSRAKLKFDSFDPFHIKVRDQFMARSIDKACKEYKANQVLTVGSMHGGVASILKEMGHTVISLFIIDHEPLYDPSLESIARADNDIKLRTGDAEYMKKYGYEGMYVANFYDDPAGAEASIIGFSEEL